ncbi:hypothetical protein M404DRAFT_849753 [Pisolithus tinctorius Marx 270]|uniref:Uncharacterized protein n=1 Tax=Pisolithus tinctorius Marx 270 TaxID=870435 RepID=A0A0C3INM7_PISTI|nr:hypothetical protein M404DRAFT_849753 [Pisolithus tinctorius Marx 270]
MYFKLQCCLSVLFAEDLRRLCHIIRQCLTTPSRPLPLMSPTSRCTLTTLATHPVSPAQWEMETSPTRLTMPLFPVRCYTRPKSPDSWVTAHRRSMHPVA